MPRNRAPAGPAATFRAPVALNVALGRSTSASDLQFELATLLHGEAMVAKQMRPDSASLPRRRCEARHLIAAAASAAASESADAAATYPANRLPPLHQAISILTTVFDPTATTMEARAAADES